MPGNKSDLRLDWVSYKAAVYACKHWHYSKSIPVPPLFKIGVWENGKYIGVIIFSRGANKNLLKPYGLKQTEGCELTRVALKKHENKVSRMISISIKFLKIKNPKLKLIISFADPNEGHYGGIYQAGNWVYSGKSSSSTGYIDKNNRQWHPRQISPTGYKKQMGIYRKVLKPSDCRLIKNPGKHRYLMPLTKEMRKKILPLAKPYPKAHEVSDDSDQENSGGLTPTRALQTVST